MTIGEAVDATGLTKKAIRYYETIGLIEPAVAQNGYRNYSEETIRRLQTIAILTRMGFSLAEIRPHLTGEASLADLATIKSAEIAEMRERLARDQALLDLFLDEGLSVEELGRLHRRLDEIGQDLPGYVSRRFQELFPGAAGRLYSAVYGGMMAEPLTTDDQRKAWAGFVRELDEAEPVEVPDWLDQWSQWTLEFQAKRMKLAEERYGPRRPAVTNYEEFENRMQYLLAEAEANPMPLPKPDEIPLNIRQAGRQVPGYMSENAGEIFSIVRKYLPRISGGLKRFEEYSRTFQERNPEAVARVQELAQRRLRERENNPGSDRS